ncbi:MAG: efflux RND transporter periplasmic adaptor subunit [Myxococcota bacterium]|jgi:multidrug efflux system membrane fusion protein
MSPASQRVVPLYLASIILAALLYACEKPPSRAILAAPVEVAQAVTADIPLKIQAIGTVEPIQKVSISSQVGGYLNGILFREGQDIREGQTLFQIDPRKYEAARMQAEAVLEQATVQSKNALKELERVETLLQKQMISKEEYFRVRTTAESLQASVKIQEALLKEAALNLAFCTIRSPISGRAGSLMVHKGDLIKASDTVFVAINQIDPISVKFSIPEKDLGAVRSAWAAGPVPVVAALSRQDNPVAGKLSFVDNAVDVQTGSILLKAEFENKRGLLWPGQYVEVAAVLGAIKNAVLIPSQAVQTGQQGSFVFVVDGQKKSRIRKVVPGQTFEENNIIQDGVKTGETVVVDGQVRLGDGTPVDVRSR